MLEVVVADTTAPVITLTGDTSVTVEVGGTYTEEGATSDGGETVTTTGTVNTSTPDVYTVTYSASDTAGNTGTATRTVNVVAPTGTTGPVVDDGGGSGEPFYYPYDDVALGVITNGKWADANAAPDFDAFVDADPDLKNLLDIYHDHNDFISDFGLTPEQVTTIVEGFEAISGVDIPAVPVSYTHLTLPTIYSV